MSNTKKHIVVVGGGTAGSVMASRLSENSNINVTLLETGDGDHTYHPAVLEPSRTLEVWEGALPAAPTAMQSEFGIVTTMQGRVLGGTSALNASATLRGQPQDYDAWKNQGLKGWGWDDVVSTFIKAERDADFGATNLHGDSGPLPVRRWQRDEHTHMHKAFIDGMIELNTPYSEDINNADTLPGVGVFPATIDENAQRVTTSFAYLGQSVRARDNLTIQTNATVERVLLEKGRASGVLLQSGEEINADEVVVCAGAIFSAELLLRSGIGPKRHLQDHGINVHVDLPVGSTMSDHLGPSVAFIHPGQPGGTGGIAQAVLVGASNGKDVDYHGLPLIAMPTEQGTIFQIVALLLVSTGTGTVRLGDDPQQGPIVTTPKMPEDTEQRLGHLYRSLAAWERTDAAKKLGVQQLEPKDLSAPGAVTQDMERELLSYSHMTGTCPMGSVLDADCRVLGIEGLRLADASVMPSIPRGNTYLGCVMIAERVAQKMKDALA